LGQEEHEGDEDFLDGINMIKRILGRKNGSYEGVSTRGVSGKDSAAGPAGGYLGGWEPSPKRPDARFLDNFNERAN
jgi:hypothetical protein